MKRWRARVARAFYQGLRFTLAGPAGILGTGGLHVGVLLYGSGGGSVARGRPRAWSPAVSRGSGTWPEVGRTLLDELAAAPGRIALVLGEDADEVVDAWAKAEGRTALSVGRLFAEEGLSEDGVEVRLEGQTFLTALDVLFWPALRVDVLALLRRLSRRHAVVAAWPGDVVRGRAVYSEPGRRDHYDRPVEDCLVLRTRPTTFPDQVPFEIERIPA